MTESVQDAFLQFAIWVEGPSSIINDCVWVAGMLICLATVITFALSISRGRDAQSLQAGSQKTLVFSGQTMSANPSGEEGGPYLFSISMTQILSKLSLVKGSIVIPQELGNGLWSIFHHTSCLQPGHPLQWIPAPPQTGTSSPPVTPTC